MPGISVCSPLSAGVAGASSRGEVWIAIADDPLVFMTSSKFLQENDLKALTSLEDLLNPACENMLQMADAHTSGHGRDAHFPFF